ncbi:MULTISPECIES: matrixin family metalloprotease [Planococcus]|uniref:matrixin family metalloprotease n=1 Tax=Planococcus TaxID=1372 RepID=UPI00115C9308|nr:matrixin family metalloprotease [Planococcus soli]
MKKIITVTLSLLVGILILSEVVFAYGVAGGKWSNANSIQYWKSSSVSSAGYSSHTDYGLTNWNSVSSKVNITSTSTASSAEIKIYAGDINKEGVYGDALNYSINWLGQVTACWDCSYDASRIRINTPVAKNATRTIFNGLMAHETGHSLGIKHSSVYTANDKALMYETIGASNAVRIWDDNAALKSIYGP